MIGCGGADDRPLHTTQALANDSSALNVLTALNCLTLGGTYRAQTLSVSLCCAVFTRRTHHTDAQVYEQSGVSPPTCSLPRPSVPAAVPVLAPRAAALVAVFPPAAVVVAPDPRIPQPVRRTITQSGCFAQWRADRALHDVAFRFPSEVRASGLQSTRGDTLISPHATHTHTHAHRTCHCRVR